MCCSVWSEALLAILAVSNTIAGLVLSAKYLRSPMDDWYCSIPSVGSVGLVGVGSNWAFLGSGVGFGIASVSPFPIAFGNQWWLWYLCIPVVWFLNCPTYVFVRGSHVPYLVFVDQHVLKSSIISFDGADFSESSVVIPPVMIPAGYFAENAGVCFQRFLSVLGEMLRKSCEVILVSGFWPVQVKACSCYGLCGVCQWSVKIGKLVTVDGFVVLIFFGCQSRRYVRVP